jgi:hypothetical protein
MLSFSAFNVPSTLYGFQRVLIPSEPVQHVCVLEPVYLLLALYKLQSLLEVLRLNQSSESRLDCPRLVLLNREDYHNGYKIGTYLSLCGRALTNVASPAVPC